MAIRTSRILTEGINAIHSGTFGSYFALRYFLPIYDPTIDDDVHNSTQAETDSSGTNVLTLSASLDDTSATYDTLNGEKLFNADSTYLQSQWGFGDSDIWSIASTRDYVTCASPVDINPAYNYTGSISYTTTTVSGTSFSQGNKVNLINSVSALSDILSGTDLTADGSGNFTGTDIALIDKISEPNFQLIGGQNTSATSLLYPVQSYSSVDVSGSDIDAGRYAIQLTSNHGDFRFNKFVLFAVKVNADGTEDTTVLPVPFSTHVFEGTVIKGKNTAGGQGLLWEGVIQLVFQRSTDITNLTNLMISNWTDTSTSAFELVTSDKVTCFDGALGMPTTQAKMTVIGSGLSGIPSVSGTPQLALGYDNDNISYISTLSDSYLELSSTSGTIVRNQLSTNGLVVDSENILITELNSGAKCSIGKYATGHFSISADQKLIIDSATSIEFGKDVEFTEDVTFSDIVTFNDTYINSSIEVSGGISATEALSATEPIAGVVGIFGSYATGDFGISAAQNIVFQKDVEFSSPVTFSDMVTFNNTHVNSSLSVSGGISATEALSATELIAGVVGIFGTYATGDFGISASQDIAFQKNVDFYNNVQINGTTTFNDNINGGITIYESVGGSYCLFGRNVSGKFGISASNIIEFETNTLFNDSTVINDDWSMNYGYTFACDSSATFGAPVIIQNDLTVNATTIFSQSVDVYNGLSVSAASTFEDGVTFASAVTFSDEISANSNVYIEGAINGLGSTTTFTQEGGGTIFTAFNDGSFRTEQQFIVSDDMIIGEKTSADTPAAGFIRIFARSSDSRLCAITDDGTVRAIDWT